MVKPKAAYIARTTFSLFCECGERLTLTPGGTYLCRAAGCRWEGKEMTAIVMPVAAMYGKEAT
ncbi:MAG: hypothetical protein M1550_04730 [Deltaproteobacteria bacterium]|nr:hypothetical protein [Deltaproteobacteria bacterium]